MWHVMLPPGVPCRGALFIRCQPCALLFPHRVRVCPRPRHGQLTAEHPPRRNLDEARGRTHRAHGRRLQTASTTCFRGPHNSSTSASLPRAREPSCSRSAGRRDHPADDRPPATCRRRTIPGSMEAAGGSSPSRRRSDRPGSSRSSRDSGHQVRSAHDQCLPCSVALAAAQ